MSSHFGSPRSANGRTTPHRGLHSIRRRIEQLEDRRMMSIAPIDEPQYHLPVIAHAHGAFNPTRRWRQIGSGGCAWA